MVVVVIMVALWRIVMNVITLYSTLSMGSDLIDYNSYLRFPCHIPFKYITDYQCCHGNTVDDYLVIIPVLSLLFLLPLSNIAL